MAHRLKNVYASLIKMVSLFLVPLCGEDCKQAMVTRTSYLLEVFPIQMVKYVIEWKCTNRIRCDITLDGYYASEFELTDYGHTHSIGGDKWLPYGSKTEIVLNKILNPMPLCCHNSRTSFKIPVYNEWVGFDFEHFDFVRPYGQGQENDMMLRFALDNPARDDYHMTMEVSFTNNPYAGVYELARNKSSELESVYHADANASYQQSFVYRFDRMPGKVSRYTQQLTSQNYLVFRTRTRVDAEGKLVSAHYGIKGSYPSL